MTTSGDIVANKRDMCRKLSMKNHFIILRYNTAVTVAWWCFVPAFLSKLCCLDITIHTSDCNVVSIDVFDVHFVSRKVILWAWTGVKKQDSWFIQHFQSNLAVRLHLISEWFLCNIYCIKVVTASWLARSVTLCGSGNIYIDFSFSLLCFYVLLEMVTALIWFFF